MIGFELKRALAELLVARQGIPGSGLFGVQVSYVRPPNVEKRSVWLGDGFGPTRGGAAEPVADVDTAIVQVVIRVTGEAGSERATDALAEEIAEAVTSVVWSNPAMAGINTRTGVSGRTWTNPSSDDDAITELVVEVMAEGYA